MKITFHGAAQTVTGSQHLIEINRTRILLECGMYQGSRKNAFEINRTFRFDPAYIQAVLLSHAHIDHSGNLPNLVKSGYNGPIYATPATIDLARIMLLDSAHIQESDAEYVNKKHRKKGEPPVEPLYTIADAEETGQLFEPADYDQPFQLLPGVTVRFVDAGHILGSAAVVLDIEEKKKKTRLWFSGDIGRRDLPLIRDPRLPEDAETLLMECTYGDKLHRDPQQAFDELRDVVVKTIQRGGKVIIPAFAVGRTQEIVYNLHQMIESGEVPNIPVIVDSPLAVNASDVFKAHPECFDQETRDFIAQERHRTVLGFDRLVYTRSVEESKALNERKDPMVIISASGMAEAGRILHHLKNNIENPLNTVLIVSWQAPNTLGRRLADKEERVKIFGEVYQRRAEVATIGGLSAHAGQNMLFNYVQATRSSLKRIFLVHGEPTAADAFRSRLVESGLEQVYYPAPHTTVEI
ncbi:MAG: MBL fold metallo-hydrolase [Anaerolineales bacterium]|nr:MBL fold metallo-hydrolase [Anaerolineales bacterium]